jgi:tetratricopeptide (TPR) repeat protein
LNREEIVEAAAALEELWKENPVDPQICNNLAWAYALLGKKLERAEELVNAATILSEDRAAERNTLGAIYARQGRWEEAREIFWEVYDSDDRPTHRIVNAFFLGLSEYQLGREEEAVDLWTRSLEIDAEPRWRRRIEESLLRHARGEPVTAVIFVEEESETR